jgi:2-desacetyl-2-hydroxyethyl bacteriochlorophyllide A dehydrogenase
MKEIVFTAPWKVAIEECNENAVRSARAGQAVINTESSIVSAGTELAVLSGGEGWAPLPYVPGYGSVGTVVVPDDGGKFKTGDRIFTYGKHAGLSVADTLAVPVPKGLDPTKAVFARLGAVAMTAVRISEIELGDFVAVFGLGLVGNMAVQLAALSGATVIAVDVSAERLQRALRCGASFAVDALKDPVAKIAEITGGRKCSTVIEATGLPSNAPTAINCVGNLGELILLGSPRGDYQANLTPYLNKTHLCPTCVTVKGAHEWRYPVSGDDKNFIKHSISRNVEILLGLIATGRLKVDELTTHVVSPSKAPDVYDGLRNRKDEYLGVVFDWRIK